MKQANRLIVNTLATYARMAITVGIGLATTRLLLSTLDEVDFGLFAVLGGGLSLIMVVSAALSDSAQRHLAYEIGRQDDRALREVFCTSVVIYLVLGVCIALVGIALRPAFLYGLTIPANRLVAAQWVYDLSLLNMSLSVLATPYLAVFIARQAMVQDALFAVLLSVASLVTVLLIPYVYSDYLISYAILITACNLLTMGMQIVRGLLLFPETHFRRGYVRRHRVRDLVSFAGWSFLGTLAWQLRTQGGQIILNLFFGPVINTSYAVANQITVYMQNFSGTIAAAARPAMSSIHGARQHEQLHQLALSSSKLTVLASSLVAVPIILNTQAVLMLWLKRIPPYADSFIPIMMLWMLAIQFTMGHGLALIAMGDIGKVIRYTLWINLAPLAVATAVFYWTAMNPIALLMAILVATLAHTGLNIWYTGSIVGIKPQVWFRKVAVPCIKALTINIALTMIAVFTIQDLTIRLAASTIVYLACFPFITWHAALNADERKYLCRSAIHCMHL